MAQTPVQQYLPQLFDRIQKGEIDPSFVITHRASLADGSKLYETFRDKADGCIKVVLSHLEGELSSAKPASGDKLNNPWYYCVGPASASKLSSAYRGRLLLTSLSSQRGVTPVVRILVSRPDPKGKPNMPRGKRRRRRNNRWRSF
jgi:hypothetical protein